MDGKAITGKDRTVAIKRIVVQFYLLIDRLIIVLSRS